LFEFFHNHSPIHFFARQKQEANTPYGWSFAFGGRILLLLFKLLPPGKKAADFWSRVI